MKNLIALLLLVFTLSSCGGSSTGPMTIGSALALLDELDKSIAEASNQIEFSINKTANNASLQFQTNIFELRKSIESVSGDLNDKIIQQQFTAVDNLTNLVNEFEEISTLTMDRVDQFTNSLGQVLSDLPFTSSESRITSSSSNIYVNNWSSNLKIDFKGYNLDDTTNHLIFAEEKIYPENPTSTQLQFFLPNNLINRLINENSNELQHLKGKLILSYRKHWYSFRKTKKIIPISFRVIPRQIGIASLTFQINEWTENVEKIVVPDCIVRTRGTGWRGRARSGRNSCGYSTPTKLLESCNKEVKGQIVPESINVNVLTNRHGGDYNITGVSDVGFSVNIHARSQSRPGGGGGLYHVRTSYQCKYPCKVPREITIDSIPILIGEDIASKEFESFPESRFKRLSTMFYDSTYSIITQKDTNTSLVKVEYNESLKQLLIKPIDIERN